jgi:hypothetical protein
MQLSNVHPTAGITLQALSGVKGGFCCRVMYALLVTHSLYAHRLKLNDDFSFLYLHANHCFRAHCLLLGTDKAGCINDVISAS